MPEPVAVQSTAPSLKGEVTLTEPDRFERSVGRRSAEARATIPSVDYQAVAEVDEALALADELGCEIAEVVLTAVAKALRAVPRANGAYRDGHYELFSRVNVGVTLIDDGLYATPTIFDADQKSPAKLARELAAYRQRALTTELHPSELAGATFTLVDGTASQVAAIAPLITAPQAAALAIGAVQQAGRVRDGQVVPGHTLTLSLAADSRILFGAAPLTFLSEIKTQLEHPQQ